MCEDKMPNIPRVCGVCDRLSFLSIALVCVFLVPLVRGAAIPTGDFQGFLTIEQTHTYLSDLSLATPSIMSYPIKIGTTSEGRDINALCMGYSCCRSGTADNTDGGWEPSRSLFTGLTHAREPIGLMAILYYIADVLTKFAAEDLGTVALLQDRQLWFVPIVNPDGYARNYEFFQRNNHKPGFHRKNTNSQHCSSADKDGNGDPWDDVHKTEHEGVDLNRNFGTCWSEGSSDDAPGGSTIDCEEDYKGPAAFSEPETKALKMLVETRKPQTAFNYHSYGKIYYLPYSCERAGVPKGVMGAALEEIVPKLTSSNGFRHKRPWEAGAYAFGGVLGEQSDWMFEQGILAITPELGPDDAFANGDDMRGFYPPSENIKEFSKEIIDANNIMAWYAGADVDVGVTSAQANAAAGPNVTFTVSLKLQNIGLRPTRSGVPMNAASDTQKCVDLSVAVSAHDPAGFPDQHGGAKEHSVVVTAPSHLVSRSNPVDVTVTDVPSPSQSFFAGTSPSKLYVDVWDATVCFRVTLKHDSNGYAFEKKTRAPAEHCRTTYGVGLGNQAPLFEGSAMSRTAKCLNTVGKKVTCEEKSGGTPPPAPPPAPGTHAGGGGENGKGNGGSGTGFDFLFYIGITTLATAGCVLSCCCGLILRRATQSGKAIKYSPVKTTKGGDCGGLTRRNGGAFHDDVELGGLDVDDDAFGIDENDLDDDLDFRRSDDL